MLVASLEDLKSALADPNIRISVQRVKETTRDAGRNPMFPFKAIPERNRSSVVDPQQQPLFANIEESMDGGGSLAVNGPENQGQTWDPPPMLDEPEEVPISPSGRGNRSQRSQASA